MEKLIGEFSYGLFFWQTLIFVVLVFLLRKYAWGPILKTVNEREESIKKALLSAERAREQAKNLESERKKILNNARIEGDKIIKEARDLRDQMIDETKKGAKKEGEKIIRQAQEVIFLEKKEVSKKLKKEMASFSLEIAEKIIHSELSSKDKHIQMVEKLIKEKSIEN